jgi:hypothetical protein
MDKAYCDELSISKILNMNIYHNADKTSDAAAAIPVSVDTVVKYNYDADGKYSQIKDTGLNDTLKKLDLKPAFTGSTCDNFALEVHLKVLYAKTGTA